MILFATEWNRVCGGALLAASEVVRALDDVVRAESRYNTGLVAEADFVGTRDYSCFAAVPAAIAFHQSFGPDALRTYTHDTVVVAAQMLAAAWGTELGQPIDTAGAMCMVGLPPILGSTLADLGAVVQRLRLEASIVTWSAGTEADVSGDDDGAALSLYMRLSCAAYNCSQDFEALRDAVLALTAHGRTIQPGLQNNKL